MEDLNAYPIQEFKFPVAAEILNTSIDRINKGDVKDGISGIKLVITRLEYFSRYIPNIHAPESVMNEIDDKISINPILAEINVLINEYEESLEEVKDTIDDKTQILENDEALSLYIATAKEQYKNLIHLSPEDYKEYLENTYNQQIEDRKNKVDDKYKTLIKLIEENPEFIDTVRDRLKEIQDARDEDDFMTKLRIRVEDLDNTQENPE